MAAGWPEREGCGAGGQQRHLLQSLACSGLVLFRRSRSELDCQRNPRSRCVLLGNRGIGLGDLGLRKGDVIRLFIPQIFSECLLRSSRIDMY